MAKNHEKYRYAEAAVPRNTDFFRHLGQVETETGVSVGQLLVLYARQWYDLQQTGGGIVLAATPTNGALPASNGHSTTLQFSPTGGASEEDLEGFAPD